MKRHAHALALCLASLLSIGTAQAAETPQAASTVAAAVASPARSAADRERDARERPAEVLAFAGYAPGMQVADIFGGGGYYSELIAHIVGPKGQVRLINNPPYVDFVKKDLEARIAGNRLPNVRAETVDVADLKLGKDTLDAALIVMSYHDLYMVDEKGGWPAIDASNFIDQIVRGLKPGGTLLIIDHAAKDGTGKAAAQDLHRIDEAYAKADFAKHGLVFDGSLDLLRTASDDRTKNVFDKAIRGKTDRFVHRYRKPAGG